MNNTLHLYNRDRVQVAAHRGVAGVNIPCNTIPAFDIALNGGAAILEMDLFKSLDGDLYVAYRGTGSKRWGDNGQGFSDRAIEKL